MNILTFFMELAVKADTVKINEFIHSIGELNLASVASSLGLGGMYEGLKKIMDIGATAGVAMGQFASQTGLSAQNMDKFEKFSQRMGVQAGVATASVKGLQDAMFKVAMGEGNPEPFTLLGIGPQSDVFKFLDQMHEKLKEITDPNLKRRILNNLNIAPEMMIALQSTDQVWQSYKSIATTSKQMAQDLRQYNAEVVAMGQNTNTFFQHIAADMTPWLHVINGALDKISEKMAKSKAFSHYFEAGLLAAGTTLAVGASAAIPGVGIPLAYAIGTAGYGVAGGLAMNEAVNGRKTEIVQHNEINVHGANMSYEDLQRAVKDGLSSFVEEAHDNDSDNEQ